MKLKRTKIVATISPSVCTQEMISKFIDAGVNVFRINTAHMLMEQAEFAVNLIRSINTRIGILIDTKGPEVRTSDVEEQFEIKSGDTLLITPKQPGIAGKSFSVNYPGFANDVKVGQKILLDDGAVELLIQKIENDIVSVLVLNDAVIKNKKTVNVPEAIMNLPSVSEKDRLFIKFAIEKDISFIAHSFVRTKEDVLAVQEILDLSNSKIKIIAKIENQQGVDNLSSILDVAYGIMVARGDLGVEVPPEQVPLIQKKMIVECMRRHRPVITATQMLQSMIDNPRPTRAEVSDVSNAVFDGSDALMLSGETAQGDFPIQAVETMARIIRQAEISTAENASYYMKIHNHEFIPEQSQIHTFVVRSAVEAAENLSLTAVVCSVKHSLSARKASAYRCPKPIFAIASTERIARELSLSYGVYACSCELSQTGNIPWSAARVLLEEGWLEPTDTVAALGIVPGSGKLANYLAVAKMSELILADMIK